MTCGRERSFHTGFQECFADEQKRRRELPPQSRNRRKFQKRIFGELRHCRPRRRERVFDPLRRASSASVEAFHAAVRTADGVAFRCRDVHQPLSVLACDPDCIIGRQVCPGIEAERDQRHDVKLRRAAARPFARCKSPLAAMNQKQRQDSPVHANS